MGKTKYLLWGSSIAFILLNCIAIVKEFFIFPLISGGLLLLYLLIFKADILMYIMALITPFSIIISNEKINIGLSLPSEAIMICISLLFLCRIIYDISLDKKIVVHPVSIAIYIYLLWMLITCITSEIPIVSFKFLASKLWFITACYFMVIQLIKNNLNNAIRFFNCYTIGLVAVVIITTIRHATFGFSEFTAHWVMSPFYNDHTAYGAILAFFLPIVAGFYFLPNNTKWQKILYFAAALIIFGGLYLSYSRAAWISFAVSIAVLVVLKLRIKLSWLIAGMLLLGSAFYFYADDILYKMGRNQQDSSENFTEHLQSIFNISTDASNVERINRWVAAFGMINDRPVTGWGPGTYQFLYAPYQKGKFKTIISTNFGDGGNAHSEYIGPCAESGFIGLGTMLALTFLILYYGIITYIRSKDCTHRLLSLCMLLALITYFIHGTLNNFLDTDKLSLPFWAAFAIIVVINCKLNNQKNNTEINQSDPMLNDNCQQAMNNSASY